MMEFKNRKTINDYLYKYDVLAQKSDTIEITMWTNEEGWDIYFENKHISLSRGELEAINYLTKSLEYHEDNRSA